MTSLVITLLILLFVLLPWVVPFDRDLDEVISTEDPSDAEFVRQLGPGISSDVGLKVRRLVADASGWDVDEIWPDTFLGEVFE